MLPILIPLIASLAPYAARAIGSALGGGAGKEIAATIEPAITQAALQATGKTDIEAATAILTREPTNEEDRQARSVFLTRVNELATQIKVEEIKADVERYRIEGEQRNNARSLLKDLSQLGSVNAFFMPGLTTLYTIGFFLFSWWMLNSQLGFDERKTTILQIIVGALIVILKDLIGFWTGSTSSSRIKDATIAAIPASPPQTPPPSPVSPPPVAPSPSVVVVPQPQPAPPVAPPAVQPDAPPKPSRFGALAPRLKEIEGGYVNDPNDNGGCTNRGITIGTLRDWRGDPNVTCEDVKALTWEEAVKIYRTNYWNAAGCDQLPCGVDWMLFDIAVNAGVGRAARMLQSIVSKYDATISVDGIIGPLTLAAARKVPPAQLVEMLYGERMAHYKSLDDWAHYGGGWTTRADRVRDEALQDLSLAKA